MNDPRQEAVNRAWARLTNDTVYCEADDPEDQAVAYGILEDLAEDAEAHGHTEGCGEAHKEWLANEESNGAKLAEVQEWREQVKEACKSNRGPYANERMQELDEILDRKGASDAQA